MRARNWMVSAPSELAQPPKEAPSLMAWIASRNEYARGGVIPPKVNAVGEIGFCTHVE